MSLKYSFNPRARHGGPNEPNLGLDHEPTTEFELRETNLTSFYVTVAPGRVSRLTLASRSREPRGNYVPERRGGIHERFTALSRDLSCDGNGGWVSSVVDARTSEQLVSNDGTKRQGPLECTYILNLTYAHLLEQPIVAVSSLWLPLPVHR